MAILVLTRKQNETIHVDKLCIKVLEIKGQTVRLGFSAPPEWRIRRGELKPEPRKEG
jgi:carbon storage regulator CsrA